MIMSVSHHAVRREDDTGVTILASPGNIRPVGIRERGRKWPLLSFQKAHQQ